MVIGNYQEAELNNASYKNNIEKKLKSQKGKEKFFAFLVYFFFNLKKRRRNFRSFSTKHPP